MIYRLLLAASAAAAMTAAPALAQTMDWTGFYIGGTLGGSWGDTSLKLEAAPGNGAVVIPPVDVARINQTAADDNNSGFTGGILGGYNYQNGALLLGVEMDYGFMDIEQERTNTYQSAVVVTPPITPAPPVPSYTLNQKVTSDWVWSLRPRIGYVSGPWMLYATGGIASTRITIDTSFADTRTPPNTVTSSASDTKSGWIMGVGGAYAWSPNWSVRGEWLYADFGSIRDTATTANGFATLTSVGDFQTNMLRVGVDYKF